MTYRQNERFSDIVNIIRINEGLDIVEQLQNHENSDISTLACEIADNFFYHQNYVKQIEFRILCDV